MRGGELLPFLIKSWGKEGGVFGIKSALLPGSYKKKGKRKYVYLTVSG